jgi:hypothetical protein
MHYNLNDLDEPERAFFAGMRLTQIEQKLRIYTTGRLGREKARDDRKYILEWNRELERLSDHYRGSGLIEGWIRQTLSLGEEVLIE